MLGIPCTKPQVPLQNIFFDRYLVLLEHGFLQHLKAMADEPGSLSHCNCTRQQIDRCRPKKFMRSTPLSGPRPIGLKNVRFLMWLILGGLSFSFFVFVMERVSDPMRPNFWFIKVSSVGPIISWPSRDSISTVLSHSIPFKSRNDQCGTTVEIESRDCQDMRTHGRSTIWQ